MKRLLLVTSLAVVLVAPALAETPDSRAGEHPSTNVETPAPTSIPSGTIGRPHDATPSGAMENCPMNGNGQSSMMDNQAATGAATQQHMGGGGKLVPMPSKSNGMAQPSRMSCPAMHHHPHHTTTEHR